MLVINIELWPYGSEPRKRRLATIAIANDGTGTPQLGNYRYAISQQAEPPFTDTPDSHDLLHGHGVWRQGAVKAFPRADGAVKLLDAVLNAAFNPATRGARICAPNSVGLIGGGDRSIREKN